MKNTTHQLKQSVIIASLVMVSIINPASGKPIEHWTTKNGINTYYLENKSLPLIDINVIYKAGSLFDGHQYGISALTTELLNEGTQTLSANEIAKQFADQGAIYESSMGRDKVELHLRSLSEKTFLNPAVNVFHTLYTQPIFPSKSMKRLKQQQQLAIQAQLEKPGTIAGQRLMAALYPEFPYGKPRLGESESVQKLSKVDVINFFNRYFNQQNMSIILVGNLSKNKAYQLAETLSQDVPTGKIANVSLKKSDNRGSKNQFIPYQSKQSTVLLGEKSITRKNTDYFALMIANTYFRSAATELIINEHITDSTWVSLQCLQQYYAPALSRPNDDSISNQC